MQDSTVLAFCEEVEEIDWWLGCFFQSYTSIFDLQVLELQTTCPTLFNKYWSCHLSFILQNNQISKKLVSVPMSWAIDIKVVKQRRRRSCGLKTPAQELATSCYELTFLIRTIITSLPFVMQLPPTVRMIEINFKSVVIDCSPNLTKNLLN